jgi:hypothetical protein
MYHTHASAAADIAATAANAAAVPQGLHNMVVVRSWHSAALTALFPSFAAAVAAFMTWHGTPHGTQHATAGLCASPATLSGFVGPAAVEERPELASMMGASLARLDPACTALRFAAAVAAGPGQLHGAPVQATIASHTAAAGMGSFASSSSSAAAAQAAAAGSSSSAAAGGRVGVFHNHPNQGCFIPSMPQLLVLAFQPSMRGLGVVQRQMVAQVLLIAAAGEAGHVAGSRQHLALQDQGPGKRWGQECAIVQGLRPG